MNKNILFDATLLVKGGAIQACANVIRVIVSKPSVYKWYFALSREVYDEVKEYVRSVPDVEIFYKSPSKSQDSRDRLLRIEKEINAGLVFTFFGPSYIRYSSLHVCGIADGWLTHPNIWAYLSLVNPYLMIKKYVKSFLKNGLLRNGDYFIVESPIAIDGLIKNGIKKEKVFVVPNACGYEYRNIKRVGIYPQKNKKIKILYFSAAYPHKNIQIIPPVAIALKRLRPTLDFEFLLTLPYNSDVYMRVMKMAKRNNVFEYIKNIGPISISGGPDLYEKSDLCFMPSLLETYSANYPESMAMGVPLVVSDFNFSRNICKDAALYFNPHSPFDAAKKIIELIDDERLWYNMIKRGHEIISEGVSLEEKCDKYMDVINMCMLEVNNSL